MDLPAWFFDEVAHAGEEHLDPTYVAAYDRKAGTDPSEDVALLQDLGLNKTSILVDLGAGTGTFALAAAPLCRWVVAVDVSSAMLTLLHTKAERLGLQNVECVQAGFLTYVHQGAPADIVYSRNALHHLPDFWKALALVRVSSILKPGGVLRLRDLVFSCAPDETGHVIEAWLAAASTRSEDGWTRPELETHVRQEYGTFSWLLEAMLERAGLEIQQAEYTPSRIYAAYTCMTGTQSLTRCQAGRDRSR
jgi:ubiquinone/menaquinone biosynthesis C-methylase UbiE